MRRGRIYDHIRLLDDSGKEIELPFLESTMSVGPDIRGSRCSSTPGGSSAAFSAEKSGRRWRRASGGGYHTMSVERRGGAPLARPFEKRFSTWARRTGSRRTRNVGA